MDDAKRLADVVERLRAQDFSHLPSTLVLGILDIEMRFPDDHQEAKRLIAELVTRQLPKEQQ